MSKSKVFGVFGLLSRRRRVPMLLVRTAAMKLTCVTSSVQTFHINKDVSFARNFSVWNAQRSGRSDLSTDASKTIDRSVNYIDASDRETQTVVQKDMIVQFDFITEGEEQSLFNEVEPYLKRLRYESNHWDDAIHSYRETERRSWTQTNKAILQRVRDVAFPPNVSQLAYVHVLDLMKEGYIKPHVDAVKFCGDTIAGISLLSSAVMRLVNCEDKNKYADILLKRRSLYIMKNDARYKFTHEVLPEGMSVFRGVAVPRDRRISIICRNNP